MTLGQEIALVVVLPAGALAAALVMMLVFSGRISRARSDRRHAQVTRGLSSGADPLDGSF